MASFDGNAGALRSFLVPIVSSTFQARLASISAIALYIYDWCRSSSRSFRHALLIYVIRTTIQCYVWIKRYGYLNSVPSIKLNLNYMLGGAHLGTKAITLSGLTAE